MRRFAEVIRAILDFAENGLSLSFFFNSLTVSMDIVGSGLTIIRSGSVVLKKSFEVACSFWRRLAIRRLTVFVRVLFVPEQTM